MKKNNGTLISSLDDLGYVFNPKIVYEGEYYLGNFEYILDYNINNDIFILNSRYINGKNMYLDYLDKYFFNNVLPVNFNISKSYFLPVLLSKLSDDKKNREVKFTFIPTLYNILNSTGLKGIDLDNLPLEEEKLIDFVVDVLRKKRSIINDILTNGKNSLYYDSIECNYENILDNDTLKTQYEVYTHLIIIVKAMKKMLNNNFDKDKFKECFDLEKLYLMFAKIIIDVSLVNENSIQKLNNSFIEVLQYINLVDSNCGDDYNLKINYYNKNTNSIERYCYRDLKREVSQMLLRHPEFKYTSISMEDAIKENILNDVDAAKKYAQDIINKEVLLANWEFLRKGTLSIPKMQNNVGITGSEVITNTSKHKDECELLLEKRNLFEATNYEYRIVGKNKFEGYIGYIYHNGIVVFEKMYEDKEQKIPAKGNNATYIMTLDNFVQLSNMTKIEIISYIKNTSNPNVWRLYHNKTMKERLYKYINGVYYTKDVEDEIDKLLGEEVITKKLPN